MSNSWIGMPADAYYPLGPRIGIMQTTEGGQPVPLPFWNTEQGCSLCRPGSNGRGPIRELGRFYEALLAGGWAGWFGTPQSRIASMSAAPGFGGAERLSDFAEPDGGQMGNMAHHGTVGLRTSVLSAVAERPALRQGAPAPLRQSAQVPLKPATLRALTTRQRVGMFDHTFQHVLDWGLGFLINSNRYGRETVPYGYGRHCSEDTFGHSGSQCCAAFADPAHGLVVAWVFNGMPGERIHQKRARELNSVIYEDLDLA